MDMVGQVYVIGYHGCTNWHSPEGTSCNTLWPSATPGWHTPGNAGDVSPVPMLSHTPGIQKVAYGWGAWCFSDTGISPREPTSLASTSRASSAYPLKALWGAFPPVVHLHSLPPPHTDGASPASATILASCLMGEDPHDLPVISNPSAASLTWPTLLGMVAIFLGESLTGWSSSGPPSVLLSFLPSGIKQWPISIHGGVFKFAHSSCLFCQWLFPCFGDSSFWRMAEKCSWLAHILERKDREFEEAMREQVDTIFPSANGLKNVEFLKGLSLLVLLPIVKNGNFSLYLPLNYANFHDG